MLPQKLRNERMAQPLKSGYLNLIKAIAFGETLQKTAAAPGSPGKPVPPLSGPHALWVLWPGNRAGRNKSFQVRAARCRRLR